MILLFCNSITRILTWSILTWLSLSGFEILSMLCSLSLPRALYLLARRTWGTRGRLLLLQSPSSCMILWSISSELEACLVSYPCKYRRHGCWAACVGLHDTKHQSFFLIAACSPAQKVYSPGHLAHPLPSGPRGASRFWSSPQLKFWADLSVLVHLGAYISLESWKPLSLGFCLSLIVAEGGHQICFNRALHLAVPR